MTRRLHLILLIIAVLIGLAVFMWPTPVVEPEPETRQSPDVEPAPPAESESDPKPVAAPEELEPRETGASLNEQAVEAWYTGELQKAMMLFEQAIDANPDDPEALSNYGRLLTLMVSYDRALPLLERAKDLKPDDAQAWLDLATLYQRVQLLDRSWEAQAEAAKRIGSESITRDEHGRFVVEGTSLW